MDREFINKVALQGIVGNSSVQEYAPDKWICKFSLYTQRTEKTRDGYPVISDTWHYCVAHTSDGTPNVCLLTKGTYVYLEGSMRNVGYILSPGSSPCARTEIEVSSFKILEG